ncbi:MFS transporter [Candidatus Pacearchaeota archaeon]|nr:MFS transporter [Candidatus Pacearchaeota archaeon]
MKLFDKDELKLLWPFYLDTLLSPMLFFAPVFYIIYFSQIGFSFTQIGILLAIPSLIALIFEIPTGAIADLYGRKFSVLLGFLLSGIALFLLYFFSDFYSVALIFAFIGFASTLPSGSKEAWVMDLLKNENKKLRHDFFSKFQIFNSFALIISGIFGAFLVKKFGLTIIWPVAGLSYLVAFSVLLFGKEDYEKTKLKISESFKNLKNQTKKSLVFSYKHPVLFYFFLATMILIFASALHSDLGWIPFLTELGLKEYYLGYLWSALALTTMIAPFFSMKFMKKGKERNFIVLCLILSIIITLLILYAYNLALAFAVLLISTFFFYSRIPAERTYFHKFIPSKMRATIGSIEGMLISIAGIFASILAGFLVDKIGPKYTIFISSIFMIPAIIIYLKIQEKKK